MRGKLNFLQKIGFLLVFLSLALFLGFELVTAQNLKKTEKLAEKLESIFIHPVEGHPENYSNAVMPLLQLDGTDFVALMQAPAFGVSLPVGSEWSTENIYRYPCRFWGSAYDGSLVIGGTDGTGQLAFCGRLDLGDVITITDMAGTQFTYEVVKIQRSSQADSEKLLEGDWDLTLFVRDSSTLDYILVRCWFCT